mmetsp:Transcript_4110/g.7071  ORF Transcript_4110/g.7071 Transcript_4110/m.7071 type:complete len:204 (-) Transcript_4110:25-636(-)
MNSTLLNKDEEARLRNDAAVLLLESRSNKKRDTTITMSVPKAMKAAGYPESYCNNRTMHQRVRRRLHQLQKGIYQSGRKAKKVQPTPPKAVPQRRIPFGMNLEQAQHQLNSDACESLKSMGYEGEVWPPDVDRPLSKFTIARLQEESIEKGTNVWMIKGGSHVLSRTSGIIAMMNRLDRHSPNFKGKRTSHLEMYEATNKENI